METAFLSHNEKFENILGLSGGGLLRNRVQEHKRTALHE